ncbi:response regulator transcription factor [Carboxylicivirga linearis]|uniref:Response regulator transcription factor n=1 Tax=Carboxylicivirga linearis TaxID=1628157 RepID=A0ABS5JYH8_9BACT|nr:response regulator transcription factor [Carboxylicivirga linearis]MBS2099466.1 response regulator transcription factor [Carboxylicivirga linearis]
MIRILLVEDHSIVREGIRLIINKIGDFVIVGEYANGLEWINNLDKVQADVVLCDIDMPELNGIEATKQALADQPQLKVIMLSMHPESDYYYDALLAGAKGFILKQSSSSDLEKGIRKVFNDQTFFSEELLYRAVIDKETIREKNQKIELSDDERKLLGNICKGYSNKQLADKMFVSVKAIEKQKSKLMRKTDTNNNAGLIVWAVKNKVVNI